MAIINGIYFPKPPIKATSGIGMVILIALILGAMVACGIFILPFTGT